MQRHNFTVKNLTLKNITPYVCCLLKNIYMSIIYKSKYKLVINKHK